MVIFRRYFAVRVYVRRNIDVHTDIEILELSVDQRVNTDAANAGLERSGRDGHAFADLQRCLLVIERAHLRVLQHLRIGIAHHRRQIG